MNEQNQNIDFNKMINLAKTLSSNQGKINDPILSPIDKSINNQKLRIMKATLPYFDYRKQKDFALLIKLLELRKTLDIYNNPEIHTTVYEKKELNKLDFLRDIKNSCDEKDQKKLNLLITLMNYKSIMENENIPLDKLDEDIPMDEKNETNNYNNFISMVNKIINEKKENNANGS